MIAPTGKDPEHSDTDEDLSDDDTPMEEQERKEELDTEVRPPRVPRSDGAATPTDGVDADAEEGEEDDGPKSLPSPHISFGTETSVTMTAWNVWSLPNKFGLFGPSSKWLFFTSHHRCTRMEGIRLNAGTAVTSGLARPLRRETLASACTESRRAAFQGTRSAGLAPDCKDRRKRPHSYGSGGASVSP